MTISDEQLNFECHLEFYKRLGHLTGDPKKDAYWHRQAEYIQALCVSDAIRDIPQDALSLSQKIVDGDANLHLRFGVARRARTMWLCLRSLIELIHPEREDPLPLDDLDKVDRDLNVIYINIRGTLDNFAWCLQSLLGSEKTKRLAPVNVQLFGDQFSNDPSFSDVKAFLERFSAWNKEMKARRDPAAHRIPLSVPPAILDTAAQLEYARISVEHDQVLAQAVAALAGSSEKLELLERAGLIYDRLQHVGSFIPLFGHHPDDGYMKIFPTVPQDIGQLVIIARGLISRILKRLDG
jgi:hypothetical protein